MFAPGRSILALGGNFGAERVGFGLGDDSGAEQIAQQIGLLAVGGQLRRVRGLFTVGGHFAFWLFRGLLTVAGGLPFGGRDGRLAFRLMLVHVGLDLLAGLLGNMHRASARLERAIASICPMRTTGLFTWTRLPFSLIS